MKLKIKNNIRLTGIPSELCKELNTRYTLPNPKFLDAQKHGRWTNGIPHELKLYQSTTDGLFLPRGAGRDILNLARRYGTVELVDNRQCLPELDLSFHGSLRPYQQQAVDGIQQKEFGVLEAGTGSGKTVMALSIIASRKQPTLILVHTKELLHQWQDRVKTFLDLDAGLVGGGKFGIQPITIAIVNTARKRLSELVTCFGHLVVDECHRVPSTTFSDIVNAFDCRYMLGLSATPFRRDGLGKLIGWYLGLHRVVVDIKTLHDTGAVLKPKVIKRETTFRYHYKDDYPAMISSLVEDPGRNNMIAADIRRQAKDGGVSLVVSDRVQHLEELAVMTGFGTILTGRTSAKKRKKIVTALEDGEIKILFSTLSLIGEGFDCANMDALFLTTPIKFDGRLQQVAGRVLRPAEGKKSTIFDYVDSQVGLLAHQARSRELVYEKIGGKNDLHRH